MDPTKRCPLCGEHILRIAVRCKHCHADLRSFEAVPDASSGTTVEDDSAAVPTSSNVPDTAPQSLSPPTVEPPRRHEYVAPTEGDFEQRFLDFAFKTALPITAVTVAYALKLSILQATEELEDLAARDVLLRDVDDRGNVYYTLPGRALIASELGPQTTALSPYAQPPPLLYDPQMALRSSAPESTALAGLLVNVLFLPGLGSLIGGKTNAGIFQLLMFLLGLPLCLSVIGLVIGGPMVMGAWIWGLVTGVNMITEAKQTSSQRSLLGS